MQLLLRIYIINSDTIATFVEYEVLLGILIQSFSEYHIIQGHYRNFCLGYPIIKDIIPNVVL